jgi:hypothetical protein
MVSSWRGRKNQEKVTSRVPIFTLNTVDKFKDKVVKVFFGSMDQKKEISLDSLFPGLYTGVYSVEEKIIPFLPYVPGRYQHNFHIHWLLPLFLPFLY